VHVNEGFLVGFVLRIVLLEAAVIVLAQTERRARERGGLTVVVRNGARSSRSLVFLVAILTDVSRGCRNSPSRNVVSVNEGGLQRRVRTRARSSRSLVFLVAILTDVSRGCRNSPSPNRTSCP
jgi:hypothetical protein